MRVRCTWDSFPVGLHVLGKQRTVCVCISCCAYVSASVAAFVGTFLIRYHGFSRMAYTDDETLTVRVYERKVGGQPRWWLRWIVHPHACLFRLTSACSPSKCRSSTLLCLPYENERVDRYVRSCMDSG